MMDLVHEKHTAIPRYVSTYAPTNAGPYILFSGVDGEDTKFKVAEMRNG